LVNFFTFYGICLNVAIAQGEIVIPIIPKRKIPTNIFEDVAVVQKEEIEEIGDEEMEARRQLGLGEDGLCNV
jgi:hypothetical protein